MQAMIVKALAKLLAQKCQVVIYFPFIYFKNTEIERNKIKVKVNKILLETRFNEIEEHSLLYITTAVSRVLRTLSQQYFSLLLTIFKTKVRLLYFKPVVICINIESGVFLINLLQLGSTMWLFEYNLSGLLNFLFMRKVTLIKYNSSCSSFLNNLMLEFN